ncbi:MAG: 5'/3'-nucleotidase SurE [Alphaproteobacteria bacterium]
MKDQMRILVTNDDGVRAPGIKVLESIARQLSDDVWVVAPQEEQSGTGHALTYRDPLRLRQVADNRFAVNGTPTDCVIIAMEKIFEDRRPDLILSGINSGENLGESMTCSGTIGATFQGALYGVPSIAMSQVTKESYPVDWSVCEQYAVQVIRGLLAETWPSNTLMNVNFPHVPADQVKGIKMVPHGRRSELSNMIECVDPRGVPYYWVGVLREDEHPRHNTDLWASNEGYITVTPLQLDMTNHQVLDSIQSRVNKEFEEPQVKTAVV